MLPFLSTPVQSPRQLSLQDVKGCFIKGFTLIEVLVAISIMALMALLSWRGISSIADGISHMKSFQHAALQQQTALNQWSSDWNALLPSDAIVSIEALDFDGQVLRMTREVNDVRLDDLDVSTLKTRMAQQETNNTAAVTDETTSLSNSDTVDTTPSLTQIQLRVVAWTVRTTATGESQWARWRSSPIRTQQQWQNAWQRAKTWAQTGTMDVQDSQANLLSLASWELLYYRNDAWVNPQSSADQNSFKYNNPDAVRLTLKPSAKVQNSNNRSSENTTFRLQGTITRDWLNPNWVGVRS